MLTFPDSVVALLVDDEHPGTIPSAAVAVKRANLPPEAGVLTTANPPPFAPDAPFILYSVTKTFLATMALKLVEQDILALDVPIQRWLPAIPHADIITLRHLLRHASGLPDYGGLAQYHAAVRRGDAPWTDAEFLEYTQADTLLFPPGLGWSYSNIGYMVVRQLLETVQTAPLNTILRAAIFAPLGLLATYVVTSDEQLAQLTFCPSGSLGITEEPLPVDINYHIDWVSHRAIASNVTESAIFFDALFDERIISRALLREMSTSTPHPRMPFRPFVRPGYGMGLQIDHGWPSGPIYGHSGGGPGAQIAVCSLRSESDPITVVVAITSETLAQAESIALEMLN